MEIFSACPFTVSTLAWEPAPGRHSVSVCVKATFSLVPGVATIAPIQDQVGVERNGDGIAAAADLVPFKPRAEVILVGHACAPGGTPIDTLIARARVGPFRKSLSITGDRAWVPSFDGLRPSVAVPFRHMPLRYDRAVRTGENLGGVDIISQGAELGRALANIAAIADQGGETPGFGPLPLGWRAHRLGLGDDAVLWASRVALGQGPPPPGFDFQIFNAAPPEQQLDEIPPGVELCLENLSFLHPRLETRLPPLRVKLFRRAAPGERAAELPVRCDTLWIDTDRALAFALWRGAVPLAGPEEEAQGTLVVVALGEGEAIDAADVDRLLDRIDATVATYIDATAAFAADHAADAPADPPPEDSAPGDPAAPEPPEEALTPPPEAPRVKTLVPPAAEDPPMVTLPFRPPPTGFESVLGLHAGALPDAGLPFGWPPRAPEAHGDHDDDAEVTPPRGYPAVALLMAPPSPDPSPPRAARPPSTMPPPPRMPMQSGPFGTMRPDPSPLPAPRLPLATGVYCAIKAESFRTGGKVRDILGKHGVDEAVFRAHEAQQAALLAEEAAEGRADRALALLDALRAQG